MSIDKKQTKQPVLITPGCWLLSRLSRGGQSTLFLSLGDLRELGIPFSREPFVAGVVKSYDFERSESVYTAYYRELRILESLPDSRNLLLKAWNDDFNGRILMSWIDGPSLDRFQKYVAKTKKPLPLPFALILADGMLKDLSVIHSACSNEIPLNIVHRDICPQNILISTSEWVPQTSFFIDFGIATLDDSDSIVDTGTPFAFGRAKYLAPEELDAARNVEEDVNEEKINDSKTLPNWHSDQRCDVYSLALVIAELFLGESVRGEELEKRITDDWMKKLPEEGEQVVKRLSDQPERSDAVISVLQRALSFDPLKRYESANQFFAAWQTNIATSELNSYLDPENKKKLIDRLKKYAGYLHRVEVAKTVDKLEAARNAILLERS